MAREEAGELTKAEWKVMRIVWELREGAARDVYEQAGSLHGWSPSTVKTLLRRLVEKGRLRTKQVGNSFLYRPTVGPVRSLCRAADELLGNALEGSAGPLLSHMAKKSKLSKSEIEELRGLLNDLDAEREE